MQNVINDTVIAIIHPAPHQTNQDARCDPRNKHCSSYSASCVEAGVKNKRKYKSENKLKTNTKYNPDYRI
jgi:hypothetical protein